MKKAYILRPEGGREEVCPSKGTKFSLPELQKAVGGYIEVLPSLLEGYLLIANEEGLLLQLPPNEAATNLSIYRGRSIIVGDVILCPQNMVS